MRYTATARFSGASTPSPHRNCRWWCMCGSVRARGTPDIHIYTRHMRQISIILFRCVYSSLTHTNSHTHKLRHTQTQTHILLVLPVCVCTFALKT